MLNETLDLLHVGYKHSHNPPTNGIVGSGKALLKYLSEHRAEVNPQDLPSYDSFMVSLERCIQYRSCTHLVTDLITFFNITAFYICIWINANADIISRRKSWESDLTKMLENSIESPELSHGNWDVFGFRIILLDTDDYGTLYKVTDTINKVLSGQDPCLRANFLDWVQDNVSQLTIPVINQVLSLPLSIVKHKNYVAQPKPNGYMSIHTTMAIESFCMIPELRGIHFEIQYRTLEMHQAAENDPKQKHVFYKNQKNSGLVPVFQLSDYSQSNIPGLTNDFDLDGIKKEDDKGKVFAARRTPMYNNKDYC